ncbi:MAG: phosphotransferase [Anaerolineales bacterium]|nr:phosphotransferase [Anaerolineales bacterium]
MKQYIKDRFNTAILAEVMQRYAIAPDKITALDGFESFIYEFERAGADYILRITHTERRNENLIHGEVDWINYLAAGGAGVSQAILSENGQLVEKVPAGHGEHFLATAFTKAPGKPPWEIGWTPEIYVNYGRLLGHIHALSKQYTPGDPAWQRMQWDDPVMLDIEANLPATESKALGEFHKIITHIKTLPKDPAGFGLIHFDAHPGNMFATADGQLTLFDFDDCCYGWYIYDIAMVLFYNVMDAWEDGNEAEFTRNFMTHFLNGYTQETELAPKWLKKLPWFLKLREVDLYALIHRDFDLDDLDEWCTRYMCGRKYRIENNIPYIDFDFETLVELL